MTSIFRRLHSQLLFFVIFTLLGAAFVSAQSNPPSTAKEDAAYVAPAPSANSSAPADTSVYEKILVGDFDGASKQLAEIIDEPDPRIKQLNAIVNEYKAIQANRKETKKEEYAKRFEEFEEIKADPVPADANEISEAFAALSQLHKVSDKEQKAALLEQDYVKQLIETALAKGEAFEAEGKWADAYAHCYYWMGVLYKDTKEYKELNETLTDKAIIEASLKDNTCETAVERFEGIKPDMLIRSLKVLDLSYIDPVDYADMARKGLKRAKLLGEVLAYTAEDISFNVSKENNKFWQQALSSLAEGVEEDAAESFSKDKFIWVFQQVLTINEGSIEIPQEVVISQFAEAAFAALDPVTNLVWPWMVKDFQKSMTQNFTGIGVHISKTRGILKVASLLPDTPAYHSGLDAEDEIVEVNGEPTKEMTINCVIDKITGPAGTKVTLTVKHKDAPEGETEKITIKRARIVVPTVRGWQRTEDGKWLHMIDPVNKLGYVRITNFTESTASGMEKALKGLEKQGMQGLIIDLRFNSGGYLNTAADVVDMFISHGLIVKSQPKWALPTYEIAHKRGTHPNYPVVVMVNGSSASASEIVAGALQDEKNKRATIVGSRSYGKGSVQTITDQSGYGSQLKYTMAYYYLPSGQPVKTRYILKKEDRTDWGIEPDVNIKLRNDETANMLETQFSNDVLVKADHDNGSKPVKRYTIEETLGSDPQLATGILVLKAKVIRAGGNVVQAESKE